MGFVYFIFVTVRTLGYGDVSPTGGITKALAYMEVLLGQLYIAVLIASLIGSHLESSKKMISRDLRNDLVFNPS